MYLSSSFYQRGNDVQKFADIGSKFLYVYNWIVNARKDKQGLILLLVSEKRCFKKDNSLRLSEGFDGQEKEMTDTCATHLKFFFGQQYKEGLERNSTSVVFHTMLRYSETVCIILQAALNCACA